MSVIEPVIRTERLEALSAAAMALCASRLDVETSDGMRLSTLLKLLDDEVQSASALILELVA